MSALPLLRRAMRSSRRSLVLWSLGVLAALALYLPLYPSIGGNAEMRQLIANLPPALVKVIGYDNLSTGAGYAQSTFFGLMGFFLFTIAAVGWGTAAIAGEEENGSLELILAHAVTRGRVVLEQAAAVALRLLVLSIVSVLVILALNGPARTHIQPGKLLAASAALLGLSLLIAFAALAGGALSGRRSIALGAGAGLAVVAYAVNAVASQSPDLDRLHAYSPYAWAFGNSPLTDGPDWGGLAPLYGGVVLLLALGVVGLRRRDVGV
ncbi:ABC transporter permease subunit [Cryobacterium tepidiphilum]|uniref:ABC transporter permease n=1 Tax=Cryobacterium tepidiphilum TaxID=2486026 RepID=A0A3M8LML3_9MICO|nr:ABC transporter permease subunit [Cryobacterium tepidiphilum]RNE66585.1 ABC transporter permease [Cryobacterium tepidiphilum]